MSKYVYPAVLYTEEKHNGYGVYFPDLERAHTCGDCLADALEMARDILAITLCDLENEKQPIPTPTPMGELQLKQNEAAYMVSADTLEYNKRWNDKAVKKTLSIPGWLNTAAESKGINFSHVLQKALKKELELDNYFSDTAIKGVVSQLAEVISESESVDEVYNAFMQIADNEQIVIPKREALLKSRNSRRRKLEQELRQTASV